MNSNNIPGDSGTIMKVVIAIVLIVVLGFAIYYIYKYFYPSDKSGKSEGFGGYYGSHPVHDTHIPSVNTSTPPDIVVMRNKSKYEHKNGSVTDYSDQVGYHEDYNVEQHLNRDDKELEAMADY